MKQYNNEKIICVKNIHLIYNCLLRIIFISYLKSENYFQIIGVR